MVVADPFIRFLCDNCGYKSTVSESYAGKQIRCPKCYNIISIPKIKSTGTTGQSSPGKTKTSTSEETDEYEQELEEESQAESEPVDERKLPWLIDIFLYPFNVAGLMNLAIFIAKAAARE